MLRKQKVSHSVFVFTHLWFWFNKLSYKFDTYLYALLSFLAFLSLTGSGFDFIYKLLISPFRILPASVNKIANASPITLTSNRRWFTISSLPLYILHHFRRILSHRTAFLLFKFLYWWLNKSKRDAYSKKNMPHKNGNETPQILLGNPRRGKSTGREEASHNDLSSIKLK